jgi:hypothetical protein
MAASPKFQSLEKLELHLSTLPRPKPGYRRVFRGQNRDFGKMLPSGLRHSSREYWSLWQRHAMLIANFEPNSQRAAARGVPSTSDMLFYWVHAIAQHYGGDSHYLDVTHDLQSALWFALHTMRPVPVKLSMGVGTELDPQNDVQIGLKCWRYERFIEESGWLYVFDAPDWDNDSPLEHGTLVDVAAQAPSLITASTRMTVQRACLLNADPEVRDLKQFYACEPLRVAWPMADADRVQATTSYMFPVPSKDQWYAIFCRLPFVPTLNVDTLSLGYERPIPVTQYISDSKPEADDVFDRVEMTSPALARTEMLMAMQRGDNPGLLLALDSATVILLEAALIALQPATLNAQWNIDLLMSDIPSSTPAFVVSSDQVLDQTDLTNVFVEFSLMERTAIESRTGVRAPEVTGGLWLVRKDGKMFASFYIRSESGGYALLHLNILPGRPGSFEFETAPGEKLPQDMAAKLMSPLCAALLSLRWLNREPKILPYAAITTDPGTPNGKHLTAVDHSFSQLHRLPGRFEGAIVHVLRLNNEVFCGPARSDDLFTVSAASPYGEIPKADIERARVSGRPPR